MIPWIAPSPTKVSRAGSSFCPWLSHTRSGAGISFACSNARSIASAKLSALR